MSKYYFKEIFENGIKTNEEEKQVIINNIKIPKIQRDYAQGRESEEEVRGRFLDDIFKTLSDKSKTLELDFIYGTINNDNDFIPLDGQQRLTTLFLLYWYIGTRELDENKLTDLYSKIKFTYETRNSSTNFCEKILRINNKIQFNEKPSNELKNLPLFFNSYLQDPTIKSMLNMLDAIHEKYNKCEKKPLFKELENIKFYVLLLDGFGLTEKLYITMNARGKQLTDFENFKADLINWMKDEKNQDFENFKQEKEIRGRKVPYHLYISIKLDTEWTDFFWDYINSEDNVQKEGINLENENKEIDPLMKRFFYQYFLNQYILKYPGNSGTIDKEPDYIILEKYKNKYNKFDVFYNLLTFEKIDKFRVMFDKLKKNWDNIKDNISPSWDNDNKWTFIKDFSNMTERVIFFAITKYLEQEKDFDYKTFKQWMRVVWNIAENTNIGNVSAMVGVMGLFEELSKNNRCYNIYEYLADDKTEIKSQSSVDEVTEERLKAKYTNKEGIEGLEWEKEFISAEGHKLFRGFINFIITDNMKIEEFKRRKKMAFKVFSEEESGINKKYREEHIFIRALISRYTDKDLLNKYFYEITDTENKIRALKRILSNKDIKEAILKWFALPDEDDLKNELQKAIEEDTKIKEFYGFSRENIKQIHESLYKDANFHKWIQANEVIRLYFSPESHMYINKDLDRNEKRVMLDTCRNKIIEYIISEGKGNFITDSEIEGNPSYFKGRDIIVKGHLNNYDYRITFDRIKELKIERKTNNNDWDVIGTIYYIEKEDEIREFKEAEIREFIREKIFSE